MVVLLVFVALSLESDPPKSEKRRALLNLGLEPSLCLSKLLAINAWFNFTCYHPPGQPRGQVQPFGPGGGELFEAVLSRGEGAGQIENNFLLFPRSCAVRHFSVDAGPRREDCLFPGRISRICSRLVREDNLSKLKSVVEGTFILNC